MNLEALITATNRAYVRLNQAQRRYDSQEHPDYWNDREEEYEREAEEKENGKTS